MIDRTVLPRFFFLTWLVLCLAVMGFAQEPAEVTTAADADQPGVIVDTAPAEAGDAGTDGAGDPNAGKAIFRSNCASCHAGNMVVNATGPALAGLEERWAAYPREDLYKWIRNSQALIQTGQPRAVELWEQYGPAIMSNFNGLSDQDIENTIAYVNFVVAGGDKVATTTEIGGVPVETETDNTFLFIILGLVLLALAVVLARVSSNLSYMVATREGNAPAERKTLLDLLTSKGIIAFVIFAAVVIGGFKTVNNAIAMGRQQDYSPEQPIKFEHSVHSGIHKIECQYCHDGARRSKHSVIPAVNTCMNCHRAIKVGSQYGTAELTKIYAAIGYDPTTDKYIDDYENMNDEDVKPIFEKWIADNYIKERDAEGKDYDDVEDVVDEQINGLYTALSANDVTESYNKLAGPIEWVRIHNLPDHVYFNHAQHVTVGQLECQNCHGPIQEMEKVYQYSPLSMGWCINCHRQTEVKFKDNDYYQAYENYHEQIQAGERTAVTVEDVGGLNCQRCHY